MNMPMDPRQRALRIAVAAVYADRAATALAFEKNAYRKENPVGTRVVVASDEDNTVLVGAVAVAKPAISQPRVDIDEAAAIPWVLEHFDTEFDNVVEQKMRPQWRATVIAAAKKARRDGRPLPPGVTITDVEPAKPAVSWTVEKDEDGEPIDAASLLVDMARRGVIDVPEILRLEGPKQ